MTSEARPAGLEAPYVLADPVAMFAAFCGMLRTDDARSEYPPFVLEDWQREIARSILVDRVVETLVLIPKGNGKTTLLAALALWHLLTTGTARCYIGAASAQQAGEMYTHAKGFIDRDMIYGSGELVALLTVQPGYKRIKRRDDGGFIEVRAADANTQDGVGPTLALVDEYHRHPSDALYSVFRDGLDKRDGQLVTISTAGDDEVESPLGRLRTGLYRHIAKRDGRYLYAHDEDGSAVLHEWALRPEDDPEDLQLVAMANPLSSITIDKLRRRRASPSMTKGKWARFTCNLWGAGDDAAISRAEWNALYDETAVIPDGADVWLGVDLGWRWDTTALVPLWWDDEAQRLVVGPPTILVPPRDNTQMDDALVVAGLRWYADRYRVTVVYDPGASAQVLMPRLADEMEAEGDGPGIVALAEHPQDPSPMADGAMRTVEAVRTGGLAHAGDAGRTNTPGRGLEDVEVSGFTRQVLLATAEPIRGDEERFRFGKPSKRTAAKRKRGEERDFRCNDGAVALAMAVRVAQTVEAEPEYEPWVA